MEMKTAFELEVMYHYQKTNVGYDPLQVIAKYDREVTNPARVDEANRLH